MVFRKIVLLLTLLSLPFYSVASDLMPVKPNEFAYYMLYIIKDTLPSLHITQSPIDNVIGRRMIDIMLDKLDPHHIYYTDRFVREIRDSDVHLEINNVNLKALYSLVDRLYLEKKIIYSLYEDTLSSISESDFDRKININVKYERNTSNAFPLNEDHRKELLRRVIIGSIGSRIADGESFESGLENVKKELFNNALLIDKKINSDSYLYFILNSLFESYDPHSRYLDNRDLNVTKSSNKNKEYRIGIEFEISGKYPVITRILKGSEAEKSNKLQVGDIIVGVGIDNNWNDLEGLSSSQVVSLVSSLMGDEGLVGFKCMSKDNLPYMATLRMGEADNESGSVKYYKYQSKFDNKATIDVLRVPTFYSGMSDEIKAIFQKHKIKNLVIDLRGNGGGSFEESLNIVSLFIEGGDIVSVKDKNGMSTYQDNNAMHFDGKLVVLVDHDTASAAELVSSGLQENKNAVIVGSRTYGKGTVQRFIDFSDGNYGLPFKENELGGVMVTIASYYSPSGRSVQLNGVTPDISLNPTEEINHGENDLSNALLLPTIINESFIEKSQLPWQSDLKSYIFKDIAENSLINYYVNNAYVGLPIAKQKNMSIKDWKLEMADENSRKLAFINLNRKYQGISQLKSLDDLESDYKVIDIPMELIATNLKKLK